MQAEDDKISEKEETVEVTLVPPSVPGLTGEYFKDKNLQNLAFTRTDSTVEFDWKEGSPDRDKVEDNDFSIRWSGYVQPKYSERYTFTTTSDDDDGVRLWVNGESLIDELIRKSPATAEGSITFEGSITLEAGKAYPIKLEYLENSGNANVKLEWESASQERQIIPESQLFVDFYTVDSNENQATVEIIDNDNADIEFANKVEVESADGKTSTYTSTFTPVNTSEKGTSEIVGLRLTTRPDPTDKGVKLKLSNPDPTEGEVSPTILRFTPDNWNEYQDVTITGLADSASDGDIAYEITVDTETEEPNYKNKTTIIPVTNIDNNTNIELANKIEFIDTLTGETRTSYTLSNEVITSEDGTSNIIGVRLPKVPTANVTVELSEVDTTEGEATPTNLTFTPKNWDKYQDVTITGLPDSESDGDQEYNIKINVESDDPVYNNQTTIKVTNTDIDDTTQPPQKPTASIQVIKEMTEEEAGQVEISLSQPVSEGETVTVQFSADDNTAIEGEDYKLSNKLFINSIADDNKTQLFDNPFGEESPGNNVKISFGDVDGDGDKDAVVGIADGSIKYFENPGIGNLQARSGINNPFKNFKVSSDAAPALVDINGDSKLDLVVGEGDDKLVGAGDGKLSYFVNKSNSDNTIFLNVDNPDFNLANPFSGIKANSNSIPTFGDLNGDDKLDLVLGAQDGSVTYYFNQGTATEPLFKSNSGSNIANLGNKAIPQLIDWDLDKDLDIIASNSDGEIKYLRNSDSKSPNFTLAQVKPLPGIRVDPDSALSFVDLDEDGDIDAFIGTPNEGIKYVEQFQAVTFKAGERTKQVTIQPIQDQVDEGEKESFNIALHSGIGENNDYEVDSESNQVELTIIDDDTAGVTVTPKKADRTTSETGKTLTYTARLDTKPTDVVQVYFGSNDNTEARLRTSKSEKVQLEVDNGNNSNDFPDNKGAFFFKGDGTRQATTQKFNATNIDKVNFDLIFGNGNNGGDTPEDDEGVLVEYSTNGGVNWSIITRYDTQDYTEWTTIKQEIPLEARTPNTQLRWRQISHDGNNSDNWGLAKVKVPIEAEVIQLEFTPDNWDKPQEFFVSGIDDNIDDNNVPYKIITTVQSEDIQYNTQKRGTQDRVLEVDPIQLTNNDDADEAQLTIEKMTDGVAEGRENIYKVKLSTQPTGEVRVIADPKNDQISLNDEDYGDPMTLVFDETNWNVEQVVRVSAFDDNIVEFTHESQIEFEIESGKYKDFESKANNNSSDGAIDLGEIKGGYTWKNLGVAGTDRDWFKFTLTDAATTEDFVRVDITEGNTENLKFNIYKGGNLSRVEKTTGFTFNSGSLDEEGILTLLDDEYAEISKDRIGDWGSEDFEVSLSIKSNTGDNKIAGDPIRNYGALFIRALQESPPFTGPSAFLYNNGSILFRLRGDERLTLPAGTVSSWSDWNDLKFKYIADSKTLKIFVNGQEKGSKQLTKTVELSDFVDAPLFFGRNHINPEVQSLNANIKNLSVSGVEGLQSIIVEQTVTVEVNDEDADNIAVGTKGKVAGETVKVKLEKGEGYQIQTENKEETEATLVIQDDDVPGVRIVQVGENTTVGEEEEATFKVSLLSEPKEAVTLKLKPGAEIEFVEPVAPERVLVEKTTYSFATPNPQVDGQNFDIKLNSLVNTDKGDAVSFDIKLKENPSENVTVKIYNANDADPQEITFTSDETTVVNKVTGEKKPGNWNEVRKINL